MRAVITRYVGLTGTGTTRTTGIAQRSFCVLWFCDTLDLERAFDFEWDSHKILGLSDICDGNGGR